MKINSVCAYCGKSYSYEESWYVRNIVRVFYLPWNRPASNDNQCPACRKAIVKRNQIEDEIRIEEWNKEKEKTLRTDFEELKREILENR